jgi:phage terminase large subunit-like protein
VNEPRLLLPAMDPVPWPTLGPELADWFEEHLVHGPGDVRGQRIELTDEERLFLYRAYEVYPHGDPQAGRRRFKRVVYSRRKGTRKTELAAWIAIAEMDPTAPVRCTGWREEAGVMVPVGGPVTDPYIPMVATTEEQSEDLAYGAVKAILENCELGNRYYIGEERILHRDAPGELKALAQAPNARDGARTTFQHFDETHLFASERLKSSHATMLRNVPKRSLGDAWSLETTTMYAPGEESVAELSHLYAEEIRAGRVDDARLFFDHRQASETHDLDTRKGLLAAIIEASGDAIAWADVESIASQYREAAANRDEGAKNRFRRYWLNQRRSLARRAYPPDLWAARADVEREVPKDSEIVVFFDGSYSRDSTALIGCTVEEKPHIFVIAAWERPAGATRWRTPRNEVLDAIDETMADYRVLELAPDPPGWVREVEDLEATYGETVVRFETNQPSRMGPACDEFEQALRGTGEHADGVLPEGGFTHDGDERLARHISHCVAKKRGRWILVTKETDDSPLKIDLAVGAIGAFHRATWHHANPTVSGGTGFAFA